MTTEIETTDETAAVAGEVITPESMLKENEQVIKRNWQKFEEKGQNIYRALTIIHTNDLWKLHKDEKGKRKYSAFDKYLFGEFGWNLTRVRALQIIKATRTAMIEAGEMPATANEPRKRSAPEVSTEKAAKVTADQLEKVLTAFGTRTANIDEGDPDREAIVNLYNDAYEVIGSYIADLRSLVARIEEGAAETAPEATSEAVAV